MSIYTIRQHGDLLEKTAADFIQDRFEVYERVWQIYIGHRGDGSMAEIPGYSIENNLKRERFSQNSYTVLQSLYLAHRMVERNVFDGPITTAEQFLDFLDSFVLFFAHLGRALDNLEKASTYLEFINTKDIYELKKELYYSRNVVLHGHQIPITINRNNTIEIPKICTSIDDLKAWNDRVHIWKHSSSMALEAPYASIKGFFRDLVSICSQVYEKFYSEICNELKRYKVQIKFELLPPREIAPNVIIPSASGVTSYSEFDLEATRKYLNLDAPISGSSSSKE